MLIGDYATPQGDIPFSFRKIGIILSTLAVLGWCSYTYLDFYKQQQVDHFGRCRDALVDSKSATDSLKVVRLDPFCIPLLTPQTPSTPLDTTVVKS